MLAVIGAPATGKSTFVHCALDLKTTTSPISSKKVSLGGRVSLVRLVELGLEDVEISGEQKVCWPEKVGDQNMPDIHGVLALYDVMDQSSIARMPQLLSESLSRTFETISLECRQLMIHARVRSIGMPKASMTFDEERLTLRT